MTYFNEHDPFAAAWLRNLYPAAKVDSRSIHDVQASDLVGFTRCHFFGGIGGWELALQLAGWTGPVWTGSCPCQPFSSAGKRKGTQDERHLWPEFFRLIEQCRPAYLFGEQVASKDGLGWLDGVFADLEGAGYTCRACDTCAAGVGAPHIRQRLYWVAYAASPSGSQQRREQGRGPWGQAGPEDASEHPGFYSVGLGVANSAGRIAGRIAAAPARYGSAVESTSGSDRLEHAESDGWQQRRAEPDGRGVAGGCGVGGVGDTHGLGEGPVGGVQPGTGTKSAGSVGGMGIAGTSGLSLSERGELPGTLGDHEGRTVEQSGGSPWANSILIPCRDGKARRVSSQPGDEPLAANVSKNLGPLLARLEGMGIGPKDAKRIIKAARGNRVGRLRGYGNAIVPGVAAVFIRAVMEALDGR